MSTPQERLRELVTKGQELASKGTRSAEESTEMEGILIEARELQAQIEQNGKFAELNDFAGRSAGTLGLASSNAAQVVGWEAAGETHATQHESGALRIAEEVGEGTYNPAIRSVVNRDEYGTALRQYLRTSIGGTTPAAAIRTLNEGADSAGGFFVPEDVLNQVIAKKPAPTRLQTRVRMLQTGRDQLTIPALRYTADDKYTSPVRVTWTGEAPSSDTQARATDPVTGQVSIPVHTAMLSLAISNNMIEDTDFPLLNYIAAEFGQTIELMRDDVIVNGTGLGQPRGILQTVSVGGSDTTKVKGIKSGTNGSIGTDGKYFGKISFDLPEQYDENSAWFFNKTNTAQALAALTDSNGRFLWGAGLQDSGIQGSYLDRMLMGYPVMFSAFMPDIATGAYPIGFGDLTGYYMVNRVGLSIQVLREKYAESNVVVVLGRVRLGGLVAEPWKLRVGQTSA